MRSRFSAQHLGTVWDLPHMGYHAISGKQVEHTARSPLAPLSVGSEPPIEVVRAILYSRQGFVCVIKAR